MSMRAAGIRSSSHDSRPNSDTRGAHALKNHLAVILGYSELLLAETPDGDPRRADLQEMHQAARAMMTIISEAQR
jgi:signal transduction histidine kinase